MPKTLAQLLTEIQQNTPTVTSRGIGQLLIKQNGREQRIQIPSSTNGSSIQRFK
ncbi:MAG: hypothetical protein AAGA75_17935 [Cyanobacteria bacterium P01_E01_bin.6]